MHLAIQILLVSITDRQDLWRLQVGPTGCKPLSSEKKTALVLQPVGKTSTTVIKEEEDGMENLDTEVTVFIVATFPSHFKETQWLSYCQWLLAYYFSKLPSI